jgi:hypothetical protein
MCGAVTCSTSTTGPIVENDSTLMDTPSQGAHPWELVNMSFLATASTETLSFLARIMHGRLANVA